MTLPKLIVCVGLLSLPCALKASTEPTPTQTEWVIVLEDPRPARLQGWQRGEYSGAGDYAQALELKRFGQRVARKHNFHVRDEWFIESLGVYCLVATFSQDNEQDALSRLRQDKQLKWVQASNTFKLLQSSISNSSETPRFDAPELGLPASIDGAGIEVAVVDSAIDDSHSSLVKRVIDKRDFVAEDEKRTSGEAHGTGMASIIAANRESVAGVTGIAPAARIKAFRGCWETINKTTTVSQNCDTLSLARALDAVAIKGANILNLSLSGPRDQLLDRLITRIVARDTWVVTAYDPARELDARFPTIRPGVLMVKADSHQTQHTVFAAPSVKIVAAPGNRANLMQGHSVATAYTTGVLALCAQLEGQLNKSICGDLMFKLNAENTPTDLRELVGVLEQQNLE